MKLYSYNQGSASAKALAETLGIKRIKHEGHLINADLVLNWGASFINARVNYQHVLNTPDAVKRASNKLQAFQLMDGTISIPEWTESREEAADWLMKGSDVVSRTILNGHSGKGIEITASEERFDKEIPEAPLYVKYIPKKQEYRLHVFHDDVFFVQRKARDKDVPDDEVNWKVRNHQNGFIYANQDVVVADEAKEEAKKAIAALGLDFGAVDIIWNEKQDKYYVLEVNTAPGLAGTTLYKYVEQFKKYL